MRPATALSADGPQNLLDAVTVARMAGARGVLAVLAGRVHAGMDLRKLHGWRVDAFGSGDAGPLGVVEDGRVRLFRAWPDTPLHAAAQTLGDPAAWPVVDIVTSHAGARGRTLDALVAAGAQGIVIAGTGNGSVHRELDGRRPARHGRRHPGAPVLALPARWCRRSAARRTAFGWRADARAGARRADAGPAGRRCGLSALHRHRPARPARPEAIRRRSAGSRAPSAGAASAPRASPSRPAHAPGGGRTRRSRRPGRVGCDSRDSTSDFSWPSRASRSSMRCSSTRSGRVDSARRARDCLAPLRSSRLAGGGGACCARASRRAGAGGGAVAMAAGAAARAGGAGAATAAGRGGSGGGRPRAVARETSSSQRW